MIIPHTCYEIVSEVSTHKNCQLPRKYPSKWCVSMNRNVSIMIRNVLQLQRRKTGHVNRQRAHSKPAQHLDTCHLSWRIVHFLSGFFCFSLKIDFFWMQFVLLFFFSLSQKYQRICVFLILFFPAMFHSCGRENGFHPYATRLRLCVPVSQLPFVLHAVSVLVNMSLLCACSLPRFYTLARNKFVVV